MENQKPLSTAVVVTVIALSLLVAALVLFFFIVGTRQNAPTAPHATSAPKAPAQTLGGTLYQKASNPVEGKIPSVNPAANANPIEGVYQNPFE